MKYYVLDDDIASRKILSRIISDEFLGEILGEEGDPIKAELDIMANKPDIVLIDLLMPNQDGIETVQNLKKRNFHGKIIMISQIENKEMVAKAYKEGVEYFIHKPINRVEVASVIHKVIEQMKMEHSLSKIKESLAVFQQPEQNTKQLSNDKFNSVLRNIFGDLGIIGESGTKDLINMMNYFFENLSGRPFSDNMALKEIYVEVLQEKQVAIEEKDLKALEQRLRRTVNQAMTNLASLGLTDYSHPRFEHYATKFFDFSEMRIKMREIDSNEYDKKAKIHLRKFIFALYNEILVRLEYEY